MSSARFLANVIQLCYSLVLLALFWALVNGGLRFCVGLACRGAP